MSAFIVDRETIDLLTTAICREQFAQGLEADLIGRALWTTNLLAMIVRYPRDKDGHRPGPIGFVDADTETYTFRYSVAGEDELQVADAARSFNYQCMEREGYVGSVVANWIDKLI